MTKRSATGPPSPAPHPLDARVHQDFKDLGPTDRSTVSRPVPPSHMRVAFDPAPRHVRSSTMMTLSCRILCVRCLSLAGTMLHGGGRGVALQCGAWAEGLRRWGATRPEHARVAIQAPPGDVVTMVMPLCSAVHTHRALGSSNMSFPPTWAGGGGSSDPTQHAKGRTGDCPGPRKGTTTRRNVTRGGGRVCPGKEHFSLPPPPFSSAPIIQVCISIAGRCMGVRVRGCIRTADDRRRRGGYPPPPWTRISSQEKMKIYQRKF